MLRLFQTALPVLIFAGCVFGSDTVEHPEWNAYFEAAGVTGSILVYDEVRDLYQVFNQNDAAVPYLPASTFKIISTLIALETGAATGPEMPLKWDGRQHSVPAWNRDHTLETAFRNSVVWAYQQLIRDIGLPTVQYYIDLLKYGNMDTSGKPDSFWLDGGLRITAYQQIELLRKLADSKLPFSHEHQEMLRDWMILEETGKFRLQGKTGWAVRSTPQTGWFVGFVTCPDGNGFFAAHINIVKPEDADARVKITRQVLNSLSWYHSG